MPRRIDLAAPDDIGLYSNLVGFIFIFNLIVGTGALTLPGVFAKAGWCLSLVVLILLAIISYMTATFVIEAMACSNAIKNWQDLQALRHNQAPVGYDNDEGFVTTETETVPLTTQSVNFDYYQLTHKFELGEMATLYFNGFGRILFYVCFIIYLYGDLSIYSAAVARSLRDIVCDHNQTNRSDISFKYNSNLWPGDVQMNKDYACWKELAISRLSMYRIILIGFAVVFGPLVLFNIEKTKYLQILTSVFRWVAFTLMISIALKLLLSNGTKGDPVAINFYGIPSLFGSCVYSFMCHHSLPNLLSPIRKKSWVITILIFDYIVICTFYIVLSMTAIFAFDHVEDLYTLNFLPYEIPYKDFFSAIHIGVNYFLSLFPVFTLSASFPLIAITLKNNIQILFLDMNRYESYHIFIRLLFPILTIVPPFFITFNTDGLANLVAFTGSYAGAGIQYIIPVFLIYLSRRTCSQLLGSGVINQFKSPFKSNVWLAVVLTWAVGCIFFVTLNFIG